MPDIVIYILMAVIIFLIVFVIIRFILQLIFLRECPHCGKTVSLAVGRTCNKCGYVFLKGRYTRLNWAIALLLTAVICAGAYDVKLFQEQTEAYVAANSYIAKIEAEKAAAKQAEDADASIDISTETATENSSEEQAEDTAVTDDAAEAAPEAGVADDAVEAAPEAGTVDEPQAQ